MTDQRDALLALAERCEAATEATEDLAMAIAWLDYRTQGGIGLGVNYDPVLWMERHGSDPTFSLDAAMALVPKGWRVGDLSQHDHPILRAKGDWTAWLYPDGKLEPVTGDKLRCRFAATPALALTAAALRARAGA